MGISQSDKEYWVNQLKGDLDRKIRIVLKDSPSFMEQTKHTAKRDAIHAADVTELYDAYVTVSEQRKAAEDESRRLANIISELSAKINTSLMATYPGVRNMYAHRNVEESLTEVANTNLRATLESMEGTIPQEVAHLLALKDTVERQIMLSTGSSQLSKFVQTFMEVNGIS